MGMECDFYVGPYLQVLMPTKQVPSDGEGKCPTCGRVFRTTFCPQDGPKLEATFKEVREDFYRMCAAIFNHEPDVFREIRLGSKNYVVLIPNLLDKERQPSGLRLDPMQQEGEFEIPEENLGGDWAKLMDGLEKRNIQYWKKYGIVLWWH